MDIEARLQDVSSVLSDAQLRSFGAECSLRLLPLYDNPIVKELIAFEQVRSLRRFDQGEFDDLLDRSGKIYDSLDPGYGPAPLPVLVIAAASEIVFTESALVAAGNAALFPVEAMALGMAERVDEVDFERVFETAYRAESEAQAKLLEKYVAYRETK